MNRTFLIISSCFLCSAVAMATPSSHAAIPGHAHAVHYKGEIDYKNEVISPPAQPISYVTIPVLAGGLMVSLEGLLWRPSNADLDYLGEAKYSDVQSPDQLNNTTRYNHRVLHPNLTQTGAFRLGVGYIFPNTANDVQINWTHYSHTYSKNINITDGVFVSPSGIIQPIGIYVPVGLGDTVNIHRINIRNLASFSYDAVDLDAGQYVDVGSRLRLRLFAGLRGAYLSSNLKSTSDAIGTKNLEPFGVVANIHSIYSEEYNSNYRGMGPRFGIDPSVYVGHGFSVVGNISAALLIGSTKANYKASNNVTDAQVNGSVGTGDAKFLVDSANSVPRVVPNLEAKLGLNYGANMSKVLFNVELGYKVTEYFDPIDRIVPDAGSFARGFPVYGMTETRVTSSLGFAGPYLSLTATV